MKTLHIKIYEFANRDLEEELDTVAQLFEENVGTKIDFTVEEKTGTPTWYRDRDDVFYIKKRWLKKNVLDTTYDICVALFDDGQWRKNHDNSIGGTAEASPLEDTGIIYMTATDGQKKTLVDGGKEYTELVWRLLHELCHVSYDDLMGRPDLDRTHFWDYEQNNLFGALQGIDLGGYTPKDKRQEEEEPANTSRDPDDLHPELRTRWDWLVDTWKYMYPNNPVPKLSTTYRNKEAQEKAYRERKSNARWKQSLHNYKPAYALDFFFEENGTYYNNFDLYREFGNNAKRLGLEWGGDWPTVDGPHIQLPMDFIDAKNGNVPNLTPPNQTLYGYQVQVIKLLKQFKASLGK